MTESSPTRISKCPICGTKFKVRTEWHRYCSTKCRFENWLRKEMKKRIADGRLVSEDKP